MWGAMLDLIYAGRGDDAWKFFNEVWPKEKPDKEKFLAEFQKQLVQSPYWAELKKMKGWGE